MQVLLFEGHMQVRRSVLLLSLPAITSADKKELASSISEGGTSLSISLTQGLE